tara:strand:- start:1318 stop:1521 length:204 start_codon:yes stop_codon:yes gene_type:complete
MTSEAKEILGKLDAIKSELDYIKEHMVDSDSILTEEDKKDLANAREEYKKGETTSLEELEKELGVDA